MNPDNFILERDAVMRPYTADVAAYCAPFSCEDSDLDEFFSKDASSMKPNCWEKHMPGLTQLILRRFWVWQLWQMTASKQSLSPIPRETDCNEVSQMPNAE